MRRAHEMTIETAIAIRIVSQVASTTPCLRSSHTTTIGTTSTAAVTSKTIGKSRTVRLRHCVEPQFIRIPHPEYDRARASRKATNGTDKPSGRPQELQASPNRLRDHPK